MAAEDWIEFDDYWEDSRDGLSRTSRCCPIKPIEGAPRNGYTWSGREDQQVRSMHRNLFSTAAIAKELGRTVFSIQFRLKHLGLEENQPGKNEPTVNLRNGALAMPAGVTVYNPKKGNAMHTDMQHLIALVQKGYTTVDVSFANSEDRYTYKVPQKLADTLNEKDMVVVPVGSRTDFKIAHVREIHAEPQIDVDKPLALRWIVCKVDRADYDDQTAREAEAIKNVEVAQRRQAQEEALATLLGTVEQREAFLQLINPK